MNQINTKTLSAYLDNNHIVLTHLNEYYTRAEVGCYEDEEDLENIVYIVHTNETTGSQIVILIETKTEDYRLSIDFTNKKNGAFSRRIFENENAQYADILDVQKFIYHRSPCLRRLV